jgi:mutator protein MutT
VHYAQLKVGAGAIIEQSGCLLLIRRTTEPFAGKWNLPAGYVDVDETPAQAVTREVEEETGLQVEGTQLENVYFADDDPRGNTLLIVYRCRVKGGVLRETKEGRDPTYFSAGDIPAELSGGGHDQAILAWKNDGG